MFLPLRAGDGHPVWTAAFGTQERHRLPTIWGLLGKRRDRSAAGMGGGVTYDDGKLFVRPASAYDLLGCPNRAR